MKYNEWRPVQKPEGVGCLTPSYLGHLTLGLEFGYTRPLARGSVGS